MTPEERERRAIRIETLYQAGLSLKEISVLVDRSRERVRQILVSRGVTLRPSQASPRYRESRAGAIEQARETL